MICTALGVFGRCCLATFRIIVLCNILQKVQKSKEFICGFRFEINSFIIVDDLTEHTKVIEYYFLAVVVCYTTIFVPRTSFP
jgi:hypothetical protein